MTEQQPTNTATGTIDLVGTRKKRPSFSLSTPRKNSANPQRSDDSSIHSPRESRTSLETLSVIDITNNSSSLVTKNRPFSNSTPSESVTKLVQRIPSEKEAKKKARKEEKERRKKSRTHTEDDHSSSSGGGGGGDGDPVISNAQLHTLLVTVRDDIMRVNKNIQDYYTHQQQRQHIVTRPVTAVRMNDISDSSDDDSSCCIRTCCPF